MRALVIATVLLLSSTLSAMATDEPDEVLAEGDILLGSPLSEHVTIGNGPNAFFQEVGVYRGLDVRVDVSSPVLVIGPHVRVEAWLEDQTPFGSGYEVLNSCEVQVSGTICTIPAGTNMVTVSAFEGVDLHVRLVVV